MQASFTASESRQVKEIISATPPSDGLALPGLDGDEILDRDGPESAIETKSLQVALAQHGERLDKWLTLAIGGFSRAYFQQLLEDGAVRVQDRQVSKAATRVRAGERVEVELRPTEQAQAFLPEPIPLDVVYEDEHLLVIHKPAGLVVHPAAGHWQGTLLNGLLAYHAGAAALPRAGIVHRLDKDTSGLMLVGKSLRAVDALVRMIAARDVHRLYLAVAHGPWRNEADVWVDQPIGRDPRNRLRMAVHSQGSGASKPAQTRIRLLDENGAVVLVACKLHTGRTHQIRVHMAWQGCPLLGDGLYGGRPALGMTRQALHAHRLALHHPITNQPLSFTSPLPADMAEALESAGLHYNDSQLRDLGPGLRD